MSRVIRVVVEGGGRNLYYIRARAGEFHVYHHRVNLIWDDENLVGSADDADDAIELVREHAGEEVESVVVEED